MKSNDTKHLGLAVAAGTVCSICIWTILALVERVIFPSYSFTELYITNIPSMNLVIRVFIVGACSTVVAISVYMRLPSTVKQKRIHASSNDAPQWQELQNIAEHYIWKTDAEGHITYLSPPWEKLMGLPVKAFRGKTFRDLQLDGPDGPISEPVPWKVVGQSVTTFELVLAGPHGRRIDLILHATAQMSSFKTVAAIIGVAQNVARVAQTSNPLFHLQDRWNLLANLMPSYVVIFDPEGVIQYVNQRIAEAARSDVIGRSIFEFVPPDSKQTVERYIRRVMSTFETNTYEVQALVPADPTWYSCRVGPVVEDGKVVALAVVAQNIQSQKSMQINQAKLFQAIEQSAEAIVITDPSGTIEYVNPAFVVNTGFTREEALGQNPRILKSGVQPPEFYEDLWTVLKNGRTWQGEFINRRKDGTLYTEHSTIAPYYDERDKLQGYVASKMDITKRKMLEEELRRSKAFLQRIINNIDSPVFVKGEDRRFVLLNDTACRMLNKSLEELVGRTDHDVFPKDVADEFQSKEDRIFADGKTVTVEEVAPIAGEPRQFLTTRSLFQDEKTGERLLVGIATEITALRSLESELAQTRRLKLAGQVAGQIAHDINNLLTPIVNAPDLLLRLMDPPPPIRKVILRMQEGVNQLASITQDLLTLGRRGSSSKTEVDLSRVVLDCLTIIDPPDGMKIHSHLQRPIQTIKAATSQVTRALVNILQNAIDAMGDRGRIEVSTSVVSVADHPVMRDGDYVVVSISDDGPGISADTHSQIFEPYFSTKKTDSRHGSGLGLSVVHEVMKDHGGYIELDSTPGQGTRFTLLFPTEGSAKRTSDEEDRQVVIPPSQMSHTQN